MIVTIPAGDSKYYTAPPGAEVPITIQIQDPDTGEWKNFGAIKYTGHVVRLFGEATYRFVIGAPGPDCCVEYTEVDVIEATPEIRLKSADTTTTVAPLGAK